MAVMIRLSRAGAKNKARFAVVVTDKARRRDGNYIAKIGTYNPVAKTDAEKLNIDREALNTWVAKGALLSETVARVLRLTPATKA